MESALIQITRHDTASTADIRCVASTLADRINSLSPGSNARAMAPPRVLVVTDSDEVVGVLGPYAESEQDQAFHDAQTRYTQTGSLSYVFCPLWPQPEE